MMIFICLSCGKEELSMRRCGGCRLDHARYCDKECQARGWRKHKLLCRRAQAERKHSHEAKIAMKFVQGMQLGDRGEFVFMKLYMQQRIVLKGRHEVPGLPRKVICNRKMVQETMEVFTARDFRPLVRRTLRDMENVHNLAVGGKWFDYFDFRAVTLYLAVLAPDNAPYLLPEPDRGIAKKRITGCTPAMRELLRRTDAALGHLDV